MPDVLNPSGCADSRSPSRRFPVVTLLLMVAAVALTLVLVFTDIDSPYIGLEGLRAGAILILIPPLLLAAGAIAAPFHRMVSERTRAGWGATAGVGALLYLPAFFVLGTLILGP